MLRSMKAWELMQDEVGCGSVPLRIAVAKEIGCSLGQVGNQVIPDQHGLLLAEVERQPAKTGAACPKADAPILEADGHHGG